jgi:exodeoxyribonuclease VII large subunit
VTRRRASASRRRAETEAPPSLFEAAAVHEPSVYDEVGETFPGASAASAIPVSMLTDTVKAVVEGAFIPLWVRGEISDLKVHRNGHWYFCLRDQTSQLRCVVWASDQIAIPAIPDDGMQVAVLGQPGVYAARGEMRLTVRRIEAEGDGLWRKALETSRRRLELEGLLAPARKRALPRHPQRIAVVTSVSGAALRDIVAVVRRRAPGAQIVVSHAAVQGPGAPLELCAALERVARWGHADVVIIGRGGGSREDLWAFNDERVARAVAACPVPTISAVGHEIDITLCDLVADLRAPTPSAAAEAAVASREEMALALGAEYRRLASAMAMQLDHPRQQLEWGARALSAAAVSHVAARKTALAALSGRLHALSPLATLDRGYAVARHATGRTLASIGDFAAGSSFVLRVRDGEVTSTASAVRAVPRGAL